MAYSLSCGDVIPGCAARFEAETEDGILAQVGAHAATDHGLPEVPPDIVRRARAAISEA